MAIAESIVTSPTSSPSSTGRGWWWRRHGRCVWLTTAGFATLGLMSYGPKKLSPPSPPLRREGVELRQIIGYTYAMPTGLCECGCGGTPRISPQTHAKLGYERGKPRHWIIGHNNKKPGDKYVISDSGCWEWQRAKDWKGYGCLRVDGVMRRAPRYYYEMAKGKIPTGMQLDHLCRNRGCVNPDHLEPVSSKENSRRGANTKLTADKVRSIRSAVGTHQSIADAFEMDRTTIGKIRARKLWADITP